MPASSTRETLASTACAALACGSVDEKLHRVAAAALALARGKIEATADFLCAAPQMPGRPARPQLVSPRALERRGTATPLAHAALIHAVAHIEFNAINLALDAVCRFPGLPHAFYVDWFGVACEEATHFRLLRAHLEHLGHQYGDFAAHDGLWQMASKTAGDPLARMALVPRVLEARGLDASPGMIRRLRAARDQRGAEIIELILREEIGHVAIGTHWFRHLCAQRDLDPEHTFERLLDEHDAPRPVLPLNVEARRRAQFTPGEIEHMETLARRRALRSSR